MPEIRYGHTVNELNEKIYVVGGASTETSALVIKTALVYDDSSGQWTNIPLLNNKGRGAHTSCIVDGKLYVIGGTDGSKVLSTMDMFDPNTCEWVPKNSMPTDRELLASASIDGKIYVIGGLRKVGGAFDYGGLNTMEMYDVLTETWSQLPDMPTKRWGHSAIVYNSKIYVFGGVTFFPTTVFKTVEVYNPQDRTWITKSGIMPTARYNLTACLLDSNIYTIGGWLHSDFGPIYDKVEVYNPETDEWKTERPLPVTRAVNASLVLDGKIYVYGGSSTNHPLIGTSDIYEFTQPLVPVEFTSFTEVPKEVTLSQNYPNPFNPSTKINWQSPVIGRQTLKVYNVLGKEVATLIDEYKQAGKYETEFNAANLPSGVYFYRLRAGDFIETKKMILLR
jgi:N-acetylneuraminic acid mutarotase